MPQQRKPPIPRPFRATSHYGRERVNGSALLILDRNGQNRWEDDIYEVYKPQRPTANEIMCRGLNLGAILLIMGGTLRVGDYFVISQIFADQMNIGTESCSISRIEPHRVLKGQDGKTRIAPENPTHEIEWIETED